MNAHDTALALARALAYCTDPALAGVHFYAHDTEVFPDGHTVSPVEELQLPAVFISVRFESLSGSATIGRGRAELSVESQSDDETSATHSAREAAVRAVLADFANLTFAFASVGTVKLLGKPHLVENDPETQARAFKTPLTYKLGVKAC